MHPIPLIRPNPPRLSRMLDALEALEGTGVFSNNGALVRRFETEATSQLFGGVGGCVTVANATLGLMLALRLIAARRGGKLALMPSFTFAAAAQAALWAGLTPFFCDIDAESWAACERDEEAKLRRYGRQVSVLVPYATFGNSIDLDRYDWLSRRYEVDVVIDAAASLGSRDALGRGFATGSRFMSVFSMHATKTFATAEGGLVYSADPSLLQQLRDMANFGFGQPRSATMPGLNAKMSEIGALLALAKLEDFAPIVERREALVRHYRSGLAGLQFQLPLGQVQAHQFMPVLLPRSLAAARPAILAELAARGIGAGAYFSPHLAEQPYFRKECRAGRLPVTQDVASRILALPLSDGMTMGEVDTVCDALSDVLALQGASRPHQAAPSASAATLALEHVRTGWGHPSDKHARQNNDLEHDRYTLAGSIRADHALGSPA